LARRYPGDPRSYEPRGNQAPSFSFEFSQRSGGSQHVRSGTSGRGERGKGHTLDGSCAKGVGWVSVLAKIILPFYYRRDLNGDWMGTQTTTVLYILLLAAVVVAVDFLFFKNEFWERLTVNIGIVLIFAAFYFRFLKRP
jgi:hypothetical protein